ncbi:uncharacterized protein LOC115222212 [Argonauta hians]
MWLNRLCRKVFAENMYDRSHHKTSTLNNRFQDYVERRLTELHYQGCPSLGGAWKKVLAFIAAVIVLVLVPFIHIGVVHRLIWVPDKAPVDRSGCTCSCFDTIFRGAYENQGVVLYKHIYFNATSQTLAVWVDTVIFILLAYESLKYIFNLMYPRIHVRWVMLGLYVINIYPHYYSWWSVFNYFNEDFYPYLYHHLYFTVTEIIITAFVLNMSNSRNPVTFKKIFFVFCISLIHILLSSMDQFLSHVVYARGRTFQNVRDIALMIPDLAHFGVACWKLVELYRSDDVPHSEYGYKEGIGLAFVLVSLGTVFGKCL